VELVVCPVSVILNWVEELKLRLPTRIKVFDMLSTTAKTRQHSLQQWLNEEGVMVIGSDMLKNLINDDIKPNLLEPKLNKPLHPSQSQSSYSRRKRKKRS
jgi:SNF2 family DNA or RNA helicase